MPNNRIMIAQRPALTDVTRAEFVRQVPGPIRGREATLIVRRPLEIDPGLILVKPRPVPDLPPVVIPDVPHADQQTGNLFAVPSDATQMWYLPDFVPVDDPDPAFGFAASQTTEIDQDTGSPFNTCTFSMTVRKTVPADATAWAAANPDGKLREVPLEDLGAAIVIQTMSHDASQPTLCQATLAPIGDGTFLLTADAILGVRVLSLYQNLMLGNNATCVISAHFRVWRVKPRPPLPPGMMGNMMLQFEAAPVRFGATLDIGRKYRNDQYRLKYTIATTGAPRVIVNAEDLRGFDVRQTEFVELKTLGDISARFKSISSLYLGVVSKRVVVIPSRYVILRESGVCDARCTALVDSSPGLNAGCKFQFEFTLVPDVSSIDMLLLLNELNARPETELHGLTLHLPKAFKLANAALMTSFLTSFRYIDDGVDSHNISLSGEIKEQAGGTPAVANANLFISQLRSSHEPFVTGTVGVRLDDAFPADINVPVVLNFAQTQSSGPGGVTLRAEGSSDKIVVENGSSFDLLVSRIAVLTPAGVTVAPVGQVMPAASSLSMDLSVGLVADQLGMSLLSDCELAIDASASKDSLFKVLQFKTVDVQNTQCLLSINATAVNFVARGIAQIEVAIALSGAPETTVATLFVMKARVFDSTRILVPFDQALIELNAVLLLNVTFIDGTRAPVRFTRQNDFGQHPIFQIADADIAN